MHVAIRVAINGFGRIGRGYLRASLHNPAVEVVAINDLTSPATNAHLLKYDSTQGRLDLPVSVSDDTLTVGIHHIKVLAERNPAELPWGELGVDVVIESTGIFTTREGAAAHLAAGAKRVIISAPATGVDATFVVGVNEQTFDSAQHFVVSNASCTTNCFVPMVKVLDDAFGLDYGFMTTVHSYTNDQRILDLPHKDLRRARAAAINMIPTSTGAAKAIGLVLPHLQGRLDGVAIRVPTPDVSLTDLTAILKTDVTVEAIHAAFQKASREGQLAPYLVVLDEELVSSDMIGSEASCSYDPFLTKQLGPRMVKVFGWYDNEYGYSARLKDLCVAVLDRL